jgi:SsrA-binding protein
MAMSDDAVKTIASNRKARHEYHIEDTLEAGLVLTGTEVKSLRAGRANLQDGFCVFEQGHLLLRDVHISQYEHGTYTNHEPKRDRILLLNKREIDKVRKSVDRKGFTAIPLKLYFKNGLAKILIGIARGKKLYDKRDDIQKRDADRNLDRIRKTNR